MPKITKNTLLNYVPIYFSAEKIVNPERVYEVNDYCYNRGSVVYLCEREIRAKDNFALQFALQKSKESDLPLKVIHPYIEYEYKPKQKFIDKQIFQMQKAFNNVNIDFQIIKNNPYNILKNTQTALLIIDFNPISKRNYLKKCNFKIYEVDSHNIIPARIASDKQEYSAATFRRKIYQNIGTFLSEYENFNFSKNEADYVLENFIKNKLPCYSELKNNPSDNVLSGLSKYLNLGFISSQRIVIDVLNSDVSNENKETFLEELVIRKELADNFCLYAKSFNDFSSIPNWAKQSILAHKHDIRTYNYSLQELENANTHDRLWNATQMQLLEEGTIHGYLRMYWAKKIFEWTVSPNNALKFVIYLNDKYAYDSPSSNGYTGILWALGGLHDRTFADYPVTGKIRRMTYDSIKRKHDLIGYINQYSKCNLSQNLTFYSIF